MIFLFENFAESRLEGGALPTDSVLTIPAQDASKFPVPASSQQRFALILYDGIQDPEVCWVSSNSGTGNLVVERGQEDTAPKHWRPGTAVINAPTKVSLNYLASGGADSWHQELIDMVNEAYARITVLNELVLTENAAMATRIESVEAGWADNNAQVQTLARAFASISEAWATYQVEVSAEAADATAKATQALNASTNAERAVAELETQIEAAIGEDAAAFAQKIQALVDFDQAQVTINTDIESRVGDAEAGLAQEILVRATQYDAQTAINQSHDSRIAGNTGRIETEELTRAGETAALAQRSSDLEAEVIAGRGGAANLNARITGVESAAASQTSAVATRTTTLETQMSGAASSGLRSRIETEEQSRVSGDSALATRADTLEAQMAGTNTSGLRARIESEEQARVSGDSALAIRSTNLEANLQAANNVIPISSPATPDNFTYVHTGGLVSASPIGPSNYYVVADEGPVIRQSRQIFLGPVWSTKLNPNGVYRLYARVRRTENVLAGDNRVVLQVRAWRADGSNIGNAPNKTMKSSLEISEGWQNLVSVPITGAEILAYSAETQFIRPMLRAGSSGSSADQGTVEVSSFMFVDEQATASLDARITTEEQARVSGDSALATRTSSLEVSRVNPPVLPFRPYDIDNFAGSISGRPETIGTFAFGTPKSNPTEGDVLEVTGAFNMVSKGWLKIEPGHTYRVTTRIGAILNGVSNQVQIGYRMLDADGNSVSVTTSNRSHAVADGFIEHSFERTAEILWATWPNAVYIRPHIRPNRNPSNASSGATSQISVLKLEDITETSALGARVTTTESAIANAGNLDAWWQVQAIAGTALAGIRAKANSVSGSQLAMIADAIALFNTVMGQAEEVLVAQGGNVYIRKKLILGPLGELEFDPTYPAIFWKVGSATLAIGKLPQNGLLFWFGPTQTPANMRKSNATIWFDTTGNSYWGGQIFAGTLSNSGQGTNITVPAEFILGPFGTNGAPITVVWSYEYNRQGQRWGNQTGNVSGSTTALVRLYRQITGQAETLVDTMTVSGDLNATYDGEPVPGQPSGTVGQTFFTEYMGQSKTYTDTAGGTQQRRYRVRVETRTTKGVGGLSNTPDGQTQRYGITTSES